MLLSISNIQKTYVDKKILNNISLQIEKKDKIGVVGYNGSGKSTLLKILAKKIEADQGEVLHASMLKIGYLSQNLDLNPALTIFEQVFSGLDKETKALKDYEAKAILSKLGFRDVSKKVETLSGGEKRRLGLACTMIRPTDVLILDEPTNHLDSEIVEWLEKFLIRYPGAIIMVTHDRYFLERVVNKICEIDQGNLYSYEANYSKFLELKEQRVEYEEASNRKKQAILKKELVWMLQGAQARETKSKKRIENYHKLKEEAKITTKNQLEMKSISTRLGGKTIEINKISKAYNHLLFQDFSLKLENDARIGIVGKNGVGKSTLFQIILEYIQPDKGSIEVGETVKIGYFSQEAEGMKLEQRVIDYIKDIAEIVHTVEGDVSASKMLEKFLFFGSMQYHPISKLSGGERRRLQLLGVLISAPNILLLDEPTNDLDIETLQILEDYLDDFKGAVLIISHDRYFLDRTVEEIYSLEEDKIFHRYLGGYTEYLQKKKEDVVVLEEVKNASLKTKPRAVKLTFLEEKEYQTIEDDITALEEKLNTLNEEILNTFHVYEKQKELSEQKDQCEKELEQKMERWEYLSQKASQNKI